MNEAHNASKDENTNESISELYPGGAGGLSTSIEECNRGPLLPDHLREALRRYKKARKGGTVGFTGLSLEGREIAASRMGGRRLFR
jgi:transcription initiation factor TFIID subunit 11